MIDDSSKISASVHAKCESCFNQISDWSNREHFMQFVLEFLTHNNRHVENMEFLVKITLAK